MHEACVLGCPNNCPAGTFTAAQEALLPTCEADCLTKSSSRDCGTWCHDCIVTKGCWADATTYGDAADATCNTDCYTKCGTKLDSSSTLCGCQHGFCIYSCPGNCITDPAAIAVLTECETECVRQTSDANDCSVFCGSCIGGGQCWVDQSYGSIASHSCESTCY